MKYVVYGLRLRGSNATRYVGMTYRDLPYRLRTHTTKAVMMPRKTPFAEWLLANRGQIEIFKIAEMPDRQTALGTEKILILACLRMNQRLFNTAHVPEHLRLVEPAAPNSQTCPGAPIPVVRAGNWTLPATLSVLA